jgi:hypothetical protein
VAYLEACLVGCYRGWVVGIVTRRPVVGQQVGWPLGGNRRCNGPGATTALEPRGVESALVVGRSSSVAMAGVR